MSLKSFIKDLFPELSSKQTPVIPLTADEARAIAKAKEDAKKAAYQVQKETIAPKVKAWVDRRINQAADSGIYSVTITDFDLVLKFNQVGVDSFRDILVPQYKAIGYRTNFVHNYDDNYTTISFLP